MLTLAGKDIRRDPHGNLWIVEKKIDGLVSLRFLAPTCVCSPVLAGYQQWSSVKPSAAGRSAEVRRGP